MIFDYIFFKRKDYNFLEVFLVSFFYSSLSIFLAYISFKEFASLFSVFLVTLSLIPFFISRIKDDEALDMKISDTKRIFGQHTHTLEFFIAMFLGITFAYMAWFIFVDFQIRPILFEAQTHIVSKINGGFFENLVYKNSIFMKILVNNLKVLMFIALFSLIYGFAGLFVLVWNASVLGYALGNYFNNLVHNGIGIALMKSFLRYFTHGILEILSYFVMSLAAGMIFVSLIHSDFRDKNYDIIVRDVAELVLVSVVIIVIAAVIEVFVTPIFY